MRPALTRREFIKLLSASSAAAFASSALQGCGSVDRGLLHSQLHPSGREDDGQISQQGPYIRARPGSADSRQIDPDQASDRLAEFLGAYPPYQIAFLLGLFPDHLNHLVQLIARQLGDATVLRYDPAADLDGRVALRDAAQRLFGLARIPLFDPSGADLALSFGGDFREPWVVPPLSQAGERNYDRLVKSPSAHWLALGARRPSNHLFDEWIPILPGSEGLVARLLVGLVSGDSNYNSIYERAVSSKSGVARRELVRLARRIEKSNRPLAVPGVYALGAMDSTAAASWIMALNLMHTAPLDSPGFFLPPEPPLYPELPTRPATAAELSALAGRILSGQIKVLVVHGVDPLAALPDVSLFAKAFHALDHLISLSPVNDSTASYADLVVPDQPEASSFGYHLPLSSSDRSLVMPLIPDELPPPGCCASGEFLIAALEKTGLGAALPFHDFQDFLRHSIDQLIDRGGEFNRRDPDEFYRLWLHQRGWQRTRPVRFPPVAFCRPLEINARLSQMDSENRPGSLPVAIAELSAAAFRLQILPPDQTGAHLTACAEIHPLSALILGLHSGKNVRIASPFAEVSLPLRLNFNLHPHAVVIRNSAAQHGLPIELLKLIGNCETTSGALAYQGKIVHLKS